MFVTINSLRYTYFPGKDYWIFKEKTKFKSILKSGVAYSMKLIFFFKQMATMDNYLSFDHYCIVMFAVFVICGT